MIFSRRSMRTVFGGISLDGRHDHDDPAEAAMGLFKGAVKAGIAMKAIEIARREASKPANQQKAKELFRKVTTRERPQPRR